MKKALIVRLYFFVRLRLMKVIAIHAIKLAFQTY